MLWTTLAEGIAYVIGTILVVVGMVLLIRRHPHATNLKASNEVAILCITLLGTLYTVVLAFMLFAVWNRFEVAKSTVEREAVELISCYRLTKGLADPDKKEIARLLSEYAHSAAEQEWKSMRMGKTHEVTFAILGQLWKKIVKLDSKSDSTIKDQLLSHFIGMTQARNSRVLLAQSGLPDALWIMMLIGAVVTICATCLVWAEHVNMHIFNVAALSTMIVLVLYTTRLIDSPFQGFVSVQPDNLQIAVAFMDTIDKQ